MSEITADVHALFAKGKATRTELLYLNPPVKRVDEYAGTQLTATVDQFRGVRLFRSSAPARSEVLVLILFSDVRHHPAGSERDLC